MLKRAIQRSLENRRVHRDLRRHKASLSRSVAERAAELERANAELERAGRLNDEFLASMSHELRTPLSAILGLSETLVEGIYGDMNARQQKAVEEIARSGEHLLELINGILDLSKIQAGRMELHPQPVEVLKVCNASLAMVREMAHKRGLAPTLRMNRSDVWVETDALRLRQVLVNLLSNAVKFTPPEGRLGLEMNATEATVELTVWDTGIGISPELVPRLFEPFVQLDGDLSRRFEGTGLGLALVSRLAELLGADLAVDSALGQGSRFKATLPR